MVESKPGVDQPDPVSSDSSRCCASTQMNYWLDWTGTRSFGLVLAFIDGQLPPHVTTCHGRAGMGTSFGLEALSI